jgi:hypothetical protein
MISWSSFKEIFVIPWISFKVSLSVVLNINRTHIWKEVISMS